MYYKPEELRLHHLDSIKPGTLIQLAGRVDDIPYAIRLRDTEREYPRILLLGGAYPFDCANWKDGVQFATIVCDADKLLVKLGAIDTTKSHTEPGCIRLHDDVAVINAKRDSRYHVAIDLATWGDADSNRLASISSVYSAWTLGYLDAKSDFVAVFSNE